MITGKLGKTANGLISLKEKNNSQGLFDMGISSKNGVGNIDMENPKLISKLKETWGVESLPEKNEKCMKELLNEASIKAFFIFGEDPVGCAIDKTKVQKWFAESEFIMVQDYFMTETAKIANLILPAVFPLETTGSFTNTQKNIQEFEKQTSIAVEKENFEQLLTILNPFTDKKLKNIDDIRKEIYNLLPDQKEKSKYSFVYTDKENLKKNFKYGCDFVVKYFDENFEKSFVKNVDNKVITANK
jgi:formate dehydrogenase major subunit